MPRAKRFIETLLALKVKIVCDLYLIPVPIRYQDPEETTFETGLLTFGLWRQGAAAEFPGSLNCRTALLSRHSLEAPGGLALKFGLYA